MVAANAAAAATGTVAAAAAATLHFEPAVAHWTTGWGCGGDRKPAPRDLAPPRKVGSQRLALRFGAAEPAAVHFPLPTDPSLPADSE